MPVVGPAIVGQRHTPPTALQQAGAEVRFQRRHPLADAGLGQAQALCSGGETAGFGHGDEGLHGLQAIHARIAV